MEYAKKVDIPNNDNEYAIGDGGDNKPVAKGNNNNNGEYASAVHCAESIILSATPAESMILSMILSAPPAESIACLHPESQRASVPSH
jgi:hypothetical protein